jgi:hypothetical protein
MESNPNQTKIHSQVEAAVLFVLLFMGNLCKIATHILFSPLNKSDHTSKKRFARFRRLPNVETGFSSKFSSARNFLQTIILVAINAIISFVG